MLSPVTQRTQRRRRSKGDRKYVSSRVPETLGAELDAARHRDFQLASQRGTAVGDNLSRNDWVTAGILAALASNAVLEEYVERGAITGDREVVAARLQPQVADSIDVRRAQMHRIASQPVPRERWIAAALRWALAQQPGVVVDQLPNVPRRNHVGGNQQEALEVLTREAG